MQMDPSSWTATFETFVGMASSPKNNNPAAVAVDPPPAPGQMPGATRTSRAKQQPPAPDSRFPSDMQGRGGSAGPADERSQPSSAPTELYSLIQDKNWPLMHTRVRAMPHEAGTWIVEHNPDQSVRWRLLPLHLACESQPPVEIVEALIAAYGEAVTLKDSGGDLPIHLACRERASMEVINALLVTDPECAKQTDDEGRLALHLACRQGAGLDIVNTLIVSHFKGAQTPDSYGLLPIHWACAQNASIAIVETLLRAFPDATQMKDKWGRTPFSLALASTNPEKDVIMEALNQEPSYWSMSLMSTVHTLNSELNATTMKNEELESKMSSLQNKLDEVSNASLTATQTFRDLNAELQKENENLHKKIGSLTTVIGEREAKIQELEKENAAIEVGKVKLNERLGKLSVLLRDMELHRLEILKVTGVWEDTLQKAADIFLSAEEEEEAKQQQQKEETKGGEGEDNEDEGERVSTMASM